MKTIYTITTTLKEPPYHSATVAWYSDRDAALNDIECNKGSIDENWYSYLVLEEVNEGLVTKCKELAWFKWDNGFWIECDKPKEFEGVVNWAMG